MYSATTFTMQINQYRAIRLTYLLTYLLTISPKPKAQQLSVYHKLNRQLINQLHNINYTGVNTRPIQ